MPKARKAVRICNVSASNWLKNVYFMRTLNGKVFFQSSNTLRVALSSVFKKKNFSPGGNNKAIRILDWLLLKVNYVKKEVPSIAQTSNVSKFFTVFFVQKMFPKLDNFITTLQLR